MKQVDKISVKELQAMAEKMYGNLVKADIDVAMGLLVVDMEMHSDGEAYLMESGSRQEDLWGINFHPDKFGTDAFVEFDSMINLKPREGNRTRGVEDESVRKKIIELVSGVVHE